MGNKRKRKSPSSNTPIQRPEKRSKRDTKPPPPKPNSVLPIIPNPADLPPAEFHSILSLYYNPSTQHHLLRLGSYLLYTLHRKLLLPSNKDPTSQRSLRQSIKKLNRVLTTGSPTDALKNLLERSLVAFKPKSNDSDDPPDGTNPGEESFASSGGSSVGNVSIGELVGHATKTLYARAGAESRAGGWEGWKRRNVLIGGYGGGRWGEERGDGSIGGEAWERLVKVVGDAMVWELLVSTAVFVGVDEGGKGFVQICGVPVGEMVIPSEKKEEVKVKKVVDTGLRRKMTAKRTPGQISFVRMRMFFGKASFTKNMDVKHGFKNHHVLNRYTKVENRAHVIHVMKYIFPWQFGLHNVFCSDVNRTKTTQPFQDYTYRSEIDLEMEDAAEGGVSLKKQILPKRLVKAEPLVHTMMRRNRKMKYGIILKHHCPSKLLGEDVSGSQSTDNGAPTPTPSSISLVPHSTPHSNVIKFVLSVIQHLVPLGFFGTLANLRAVQKDIGRFIHLRKFETMTLHTISQDIDVKAITWLGPPTPKMSRTDAEKRRELLLEFLYWLVDSIVIPLIANNFYVTDISDNTDKRLLYFRQDVWRELMGSVNADLKVKMFVPLTPDDFPAARNDMRVARVAKPKYLPPKSMIPYSTFRVVPKLGKGYRIITNMRRRATQANGQLGPAPNQILKPILPILRYYRDQNKKFMMGASMDSPSDFFPRVAEFKNRLKRKGLWKKEGVKLYFVKLDVRKCYDTIPAERLLEYLREMFGLPRKDDEETLDNEGGVSLKAFQIHNYTKITPCGPTESKKKFTSYAKPIGAKTSFMDDVTKLATEREAMIAASNTPHERPRPSQPANAHRLPRTKRSVVYVGNSQRKGQTHKLDQVYKILKEHLTKHIVKIGPKYYRQKKGIPQGSILSSLLVNMFYAKMEREELGFESGQHKPSNSSPSSGESDESLLARYVDDFLLVTTSKSTANRFLNTLLPGLPDYGASTHPDKALCNFSNPHNIPINPSPYFPYIGLDISTEDLSINVTHKSNLRKPASKVDKTTAPLTTTKSKITLPTSHPLSLLPQKLLKSFAFKYLDARYTNTALNPMKTVRRNIEEIWKDLGRQVRAYLSVLVPGYRKTEAKNRFENKRKVEKILDEVVKGGMAVLARKVRGDRGWVGKVGERVVRKIVFGEENTRKGRRRGKWRLRELRAG